MKIRNIDFFSPFVVVFVVCLLFPIPIPRTIDAYPTELLSQDEDSIANYGTSWHIADVLEDNNKISVHREEALEKLQKIFGIRGQIEKKSIRHKTPPQFMMELYNTIADPSGVTRGKNPYNAKVVRSFIERDTSLSHFYLFNISGLEINESVLEAELHLYRKRSPLKAYLVHPTILKSPYYLIRVYQVLEGKTMDVPDLHRLLSVHYVGAHASGWQVFNVKEAVLAWVSGVPNLGLMVTASTLFGDEVVVEFSRRNEYHHSKQPILVLFDDDGTEHEVGEKIVPHYYTYDNEPEESEDRSYSGDNVDEEENIEPGKKYDGENLGRRKRDTTIDETKKNQDVDEKEELNKEHSEGTQLGANLENDKIEFLQRRKGNHRRVESKEESTEDSSSQEHSLQENIEKLSKESSLSLESRQVTERNEGSVNEDSHFRARRDIRDNESKKYLPNTKFVTERKRRAPQVLISMDIYERAMLREKSKKKDNDKTRKTEKFGNKAKEADDIDLHSGRDKRSTKESEENTETSKSHAHTRTNSTECTRHELYVDFKEIGLSSSIIAPKGYSAYHCQGPCDSPLRQDQQPTNHATVQGIVHKMGLVKDVHMPCCVPTKLLSTTILFFDDNENVVLKVYEDMIADRCGCR